MPTANWGIGASDVDDFDRDSQYKPYAGPIPPNRIFVFNINSLKFVAATKDKLPQLRVGLELVPREGREDEEEYEGYFEMAFLPISEKTAFRYVPFLDAIGVSGSEFTNRTVTDEENNIKKIGKWRNTGDVLIMAQLKDRTDQNGKLSDRKDFGWFGPFDDEYEDPKEDEEYYEEDDPV